MEELEYTLETDEEPYEAACQGRISSPEIIAVLGDVVRRLRLLKGTRSTISRRGFGTDLQMLAEASVEDFMEALKIAKPSDSIGNHSTQAATGNHRQPLTPSTLYRNL